MLATRSRSWLVAAALAVSLSGLSVPVAAGEYLRPVIDGIVSLDPVQGLVTLPLHFGTHDDEEVWYIVLDSSDRDDARRRGVNWAPKLANALGTAAVQSLEGDAFAGTVDFAPEPVLLPNPETAFPPDRAEPGAIGDADYSPLATEGDGIVLNAPHVANASGLHDRVVDIDFAAGTVTMRVVDGFYDGKRTLYISTDASDPVAATLEQSTYAPNMNAAPGLASNDPESSARAALVPVVNGDSGAGNPDRQGFESALRGEGDPLNMLDAFPNNRRGSGRAYSPLWDVHPLVWTEEAIAGGRRVLLTESDRLQDLLEDGLVTSGGFGPRNPRLGGLRAAGFIVNCPVLALE